jgi:metal-responsive CopG/Arc/MetJ family transcriptional regulator
MRLKNKNLILDLDVLDKFDMMVGEQKRSEFVRYLLEIYIEQPELFSRKKDERENDDKKLHGA